MYIVRIVFYFLCGVYPMSMWAKILQFACVRGYANNSEVCLGKTVPFTAVRAPGDTKDVRSFFKIPTVSATDGEETASLKRKARGEWLRLLLRTREMTGDLKQRIEANNIYLCDLHFKPECIVSRKY